MRRVLTLSALFLAIVMLGTVGTPHSVRADLPYPLGIYLVNCSGEAAMANVSIDANLMRGTTILESQSHLTGIDGRTTFTFSTSVQNGDAAVLTIHGPDGNCIRKFVWDNVADEGPWVIGNIPIVGCSSAPCTGASGAQWYKVRYRGGE